jgi:hypothetical protein
MSNLSMLSAQNNVSQQQQQLAFQSFSQQTLASPSTFSIPASAPTLSHRQNHQYPRLQQAFSSPSNYQRYLRPPENFWQPNYEQPTCSLDTPEQTSPNFLQQDQFATNDHSFPPDYEALTAFNITTSYQTQSNEDLNISPPSRNTSSTSPPTEQLFSDPSPSGWNPTPDLSKSSRGGDEVGLQDCFDEFLDFES